MTTQTTTIAEIRKAIADYMASEGCSCCRNVDDHNKHTEVLAKLLNVKKYSDKSGWNFTKHRSKK